MQNKLKRLYRTLFLPVLSFLLIPVLLLTEYRSSPTDADAASRGRFTLLCAGLDAAAEHTDVLMLVSFLEDTGKIAVLQIPRDTYFRAETAQCKINQLYPWYRAQGYTEREALAMLGSTLSHAFGVEIDGYMAVDTAAVAKTIDALGGVSVKVPATIRHRDADGEGYIEILQGEHLLSGAEAVEFLRFRSAYIEGDLGRMDAQKLLLVAVMQKLRNDLSPANLLSLIPTLYPSLITDISLGDQLGLARSCLSHRKDFSMVLGTLPGQATTASESGGLSYYV